MNKIPFEILGKKWRLRVLKKKNYKSKHGVDSVAITHTDKRLIDLSPFALDLESITHELVHAFLYELCLGSSDLDTDALEEIFAEMMAKRGKELLDLADALYDAVKRIMPTL